AAARLGIRIIETHGAPVSAVAPRLAGRCDRALVDAPCSNLGVLRRNPDVKWRRAGADLARLPAQPRGVLPPPPPGVEPGPLLLKPPSPLDPEGKGAGVEPFLGASADWRVDPPADSPVAPDGRGFIRLLPHVHGTDGFTAIRLRRRPG